MRRDGILTGYLWNKNSFGKVKVKGKPTNASKASARCSRPKCSFCHEQPVSKAKAKTKGRNKRALSSLPVDDEWAFCHRSLTRHHRPGIKDVDDAYAPDAFHAAANPMCRAVTDKDLDAGYADDDLNMRDHDVNTAGDVRDAGMRGHDDAEDVGMLTSGAANDDAEEYVIHPPQVFGSLDRKFYAARYLKPGMWLQVVPPAAKSGICAQAIDAIIDGGDDDDGDANHECHATMAHAEDDTTLEEEAENYDANGSNANQEIHAIMIVHATGHVSNVAKDDDDDDGVYGDEEASDFQSLISGLVHVGYPTHDNNEEVLEFESEEDSLGGGWCHVTSPDTIDDWCWC